MKRCLVGFSVSLCSFLQALPSGGQVIQGTATLSKNSSTIEAHGKAIIQWDQFNIGPGESVSFTQSQPKMGVLNRITGGSLSTILGSLEANCPIYLINGKGVYIGGNAQINTAGFIASTADISNESFWGQKELAFHHLQEGEIVNLGAISSREGDVILIARSIKNRGRIYAPQGQVILTTTEMVIHPQEKRQIFIRPEKGVEEGIDNSGLIEAQAIHLETGSPYAHAINHSGVMKTFSIQEEKGRIFLVAHQGDIAVNGELTAPSGTIELAAENISVLKEGALDTSEDYHAGCVTLKGLESIQVEKGAKFVTNSYLQGDGGEITLWSGEKLIFEGEAQS
ncbi:MAG: filamentous hemagglutinin N-terminal domain-containing protein, partial [Chlamydiia bacterium]|nr:filamentous hemagglutinin N-terminal domain-containing protein [Chlamydiia bacterium]